ncbi:MAG: methylmalonyl-CoA mutase subunit beta [Pricia sp.]
MDSQKLFEDFPEVSAKAWKQKIQYDLKGADYNDTLVWESPEGINVKPFYHADDFSGKSALAPSAPQNWKIGQSIYAGNPILANEKGVKAVAGGVESIQFTIPSEDVDFKILLQQIDVRTIPVYLNMPFLSEQFVKSALVYTSASAPIYFNVDIVGNLARSGNWYFDHKKDYDLFSKILDSGALHVLQVDISLYENAGADSTQQLGYALAHTNDYLHHLSKNGMLEKLKSIHFKVAIGSNYFFEIAKFRALRILWKTLAAEYDLDFDCHITATPSKRNKTIYDYNVNMLRTTMESMSAILGGANTIFNMPYDAIYHKDNEFGERIAINQLLLLNNESYFDKVSNPADGAYFIESITLQLAEKGLQLFKNIEQKGGFLKQLKAHTIQEKIKESASKQQQRFKAQEDVLVGSNKFQNETDKMKQQLELHPFVKINPRKTIIEPIIERRLAENLEKKRLEDE